MKFTAKADGTGDITAHLDDTDITENLIAFKAEAAIGGLTKVTLVLSATEVDLDLELDRENINAGEPDAVQ